nr:hypothetical protein CFP56_54504 [Quercus suber]
MFLRGRPSRVYERSTSITSRQRSHRIDGPMFASDIVRQEDELCKLTHFVLVTPSLMTAAGAIRLDRTIFWLGMLTRQLSQSSHISEPSSLTEDPRM